MLQRSPTQVSVKGERALIREARGRRCTGEQGKSIPGERHPQRLCGPRAVGSSERARMVSVETARGWEGGGGGGGRQEERTDRQCKTLCLILSLS